MTEAEERGNEAILRIGATLRKEGIENYFMTGLLPGNVSFFIGDGAIEHMISLGLETMHNENPKEALEIITGLLVKIAKWYGLNSDVDKVFH